MVSILHRRAWPCSRIMNRSTRYICQSRRLRMPEDHSDLALEKLSEQAQASYDWYLPANNVSVPSTSDKKIITLDLAKDLPEHLVSLSNYIANEIPALDSSTIQWTKRDEGLWGWTLSICVLQGRGRGGLRVACSDIKDWVCLSRSNSEVTAH